MLGIGVAREAVEEEAGVAICCMDEDEPECGDLDCRLRGRGGRGLTLADDVGVILGAGGGVGVVCGVSSMGISITTAGASW